MPFSSLSQSVSHQTSRTFLQKASLVGLTCLVAASLAACGSTKRGGPESAPPPMKPIDPAAGAQSRAPAPAPVSAPPAAAPAAAASASGSASAQEAAPAGIVVKTGLHRCELARRILVKRVTTDGSAVQVNWNGKDFNLRSVPTQSGARRFEDAKAGIAWVVISAKAFLLDMKHGQILANECNL